MCDDDGDGKKIHSLTRLLYLEGCVLFDFGFLNTYVGGMDVFIFFVYYLIDGRHFEYLV